LHQYNITQNFYCCYIITLKRLISSLWIPDLTWKSPLKQRLPEIPCIIFAFPFLGRENWQKSVKIMWINMVHTPGWCLSVGTLDQVQNTARTQKYAYIRYSKKETSSSVARPQCIPQCSKVKAICHAWNYCVSKEFSDKDWN
jgi:hypothetical protein